MNLRSRASLEVGLCREDQVARKNSNRQDLDIGSPGYRPGSGSRSSPAVRGATGVGARHRGAHGGPIGVAAASAAAQAVDDDHLTLNHHVEVGHDVAL